MGGLSGFEEGLAASADGSGGVYAGGYTTGNLAGTGHSGSDDAWVSRYSAAGQRLWMIQFGTSQNDRVWALAPDAAAGAYAAGYTNGSLFGTTAGGQDAWLARILPTGSILWSRQFGTTGTDFAFCASPDGLGGVFVSGTTYGSLGGPNQGGCDAWVARYDSGGSRLWIRQLGSGSCEEVLATAPSQDGGVFVVGRTEGGLAGPWAGDEDAWVARLDADGATLWIRQLGTSLGDRTSGAVGDGMGGVFVAGDTRGSLHRPNAGNADIWLGRFDASGSLTWSDQIGTSAGDYVRALLSDGSGGFLLAGSSDGSLGGASAGGRDVVLARYAMVCLPDVTTGAVAGQPGYGVPNGVLNNEDFFYFLSLFSASVGCGPGSTPCSSPPDLTSTALPGTPGYGVPDGILQNDDFFFYLSVFAAGC